MQKRRNNEISDLGPNSSKKLNRLTKTRRLKKQKDLTSSKKVGMSKIEIEKSAKIQRYMFNDDDEQEKKDRQQKKLTKYIEKEFGKKQTPRSRKKNKKKLQEVNIQDFYSNTIMVTEKNDGTESSSGSEFNIKKATPPTSEDEFYEEPDGYKQLLYKKPKEKPSSKVKVVKEFSQSKVTPQTKLKEEKQVKMEKLTPKKSAKPMQPKQKKKKSVRKQSRSRSGTPGKKSTGSKLERNTSSQNLIIGPLNKISFVITGKLDTQDRKEVQTKIKELGGLARSGVSGKTNYLVTGSILEDGREPHCGNKYKKAKSLARKGVKIINEEEFSQLLKKLTGKTLGEHFGEVALETIEEEVVIQKRKAPKGSSKGGRSSVLWTEQFAPCNFSQIIGNQSKIRLLHQWLKDWEDVILHGNKKNIAMRRGFNPSMNMNARAALISGPPGIGKTTAVRCLAKQLNLTLIEQNASDLRNKKSLSTGMTGVVDNQILCFKRKEVGANKKFLILMDEVDGMSSDRGGSTVLLNLIKKTKQPIICIANDRQHPKMRTLANHCYDLRFSKPPKNSLSKRLMQICGYSNIRVEMNALELLVESMGNDMRQLLNYLQMTASSMKAVDYKSVKLEQGEMSFLIFTSFYSLNMKDQKVMISNFDAAGKFLNRQQSSHLTHSQKLNLFFIDYSLIPLLIQENYLDSMSRDTSMRTLEQMADASDFISISDVISQKIQAGQNWKLLGDLALFSTIRPCERAAVFCGWPKFPTWFSKNSSKKKRKREIKELRQKMAKATYASRGAILFDYVPNLLKLLLHTIKDGSSECIQQTIDLMQQYSLNPDMIKEHFSDLYFTLYENPFEKLPGKIRGALTRTYNKQNKGSVVRKKKKRKGEKTEIEQFDPLKHETKDQVIEEDESSGEDSDEIKQVARKKKKGKKRKGKKKKGKGKK